MVYADRLEGAAGTPDNGRPSISLGFSQNTNLHPKVKENRFSKRSGGPARRVSPGGVARKSDKKPRQGMAKAPDGRGVKEKTGGGGKTFGFKQNRKTGRSVTKQGLTTRAVR